MTADKLNKFTAEIVALMTAEERSNWESLSKDERQCIAYAAYVALHKDEFLAHMEAA